MDVAAKLANLSEALCADLDAMSDAEVLAEASELEAALPPASRALLARSSAVRPLDQAAPDDTTRPIGTGTSAGRDDLVGTLAVVPGKL